MHLQSFSRWSRFLVSLIALALTLGACAFGTSATSNQSGTPTATASTPTSTSTPQQTAACSNLSGFGSAQAATAGTGFGDVSFPSNSISTTVATSGGGAGRFTIKQFDVCTPGATTSSIHSFFANGLPGAGWAQAATYPYDTAWQASCGDPYCWKKDNKSRYVSLEKVTSHSNGLVTYHMRLAIPPAGPTCVSSLGVYDGKTWAAYLDGGSGIYAPPFTLVGVGESVSDSNSTGSYMAGNCSAGTYSAVSSYFSTELPKHGWTHSTPPATVNSECQRTGVQWWKGKDIFWWSNDTTDNATAAANTAYWTYNWCQAK